MNRNGVIEYMRWVTLYLALNYIFVWLLLNCFGSQLDFSTKKMTVDEIKWMKDRYQSCEIVLFSATVLMLSFVYLQRELIQTCGRYCQRIIYVITMIITGAIYYC